MSDNTHAAMCVYCGDAIIYDTREVTDMAAAHAQIVEHDQQCPKNPLVARIAELERYNLGLANESCELQERVARLNKALTRQANAATLGLDAAKKVAGSNLEQAKRLHAESSPAALESEREANARLTELVAKLEQERDALAALFVKLQEGATELIHASSEEEAGDAMELIAECSEKEVRSILASRDALKQAEALERLRLLLQETQFDKAPSVARVVMQVNDAINRVKQEVRPLRLVASDHGDPHPNCELECGAYGTYCKCNAEAQQ